MAHAYLFAGDKNKSLAEAEKLADFLTTESGGTINNPDVFRYLGEKFGIAEAHEVRRRARMTGFSDEAKIFLIDADLMTRDAMHALLKLMEEPPEKTYFFLAAEFPFSLLSTLRSRMVFVNLGFDRVLSQAKSESVKKFFKMTPAQRLVYLKSIIEDRGRSLEFLKGLEIFLAEFFESCLKNGRNFPYGGFIEEVGEFRNMISDNFSSPKLMLEHLALTLPLIK